MATINSRGVVIGGLLAGLIINIGEFILNGPLLGEQLETALSARNLPPIGGGAIGVFVVSGFVLGIVLVWLYAAIRPRFGPGPKTASIAAVVVWVLAYMFPTLGFIVMGIFPAGLSILAVTWGLGEMILAGLGGARVYTET